VTNRGALDLLSNVIVWASDTIKVRLVASSFTPNKDDIVMTGYTAIGTDQTLGSKTRTEDTTNDRIVYDAADSTWTAVAGGSTIGWVAVFKFTTVDADSIPIAIIDVSDLATNGGDVTGPWASTGLFYLQE
jgi:hypothetical protein